MKMKYNFAVHEKLMLGLSIGLFVLGILLSLIMGVDMDISFKGGTLVKYTYSGTVEWDVATTLAKTYMGDDAVVDLTTAGGEKVLSMSVAKVLDPDEQEAMLNAFQKEFADNNIKTLQANALEASMGQSFFIKCLVAVALAALLLIGYVSFRFRKIGGTSAAVCSVYALVNDLMVAYIAFVIFRIPLNDNFVAVMLTILGYSLNDTIVLFDRIRENRAKMPKDSIRDVVNVSMYQTLGRNVCTALAAVIAVLCVAVVALVMNLDSVVSFAVPMLFGMVSGSLTSLFLCPPLWAAWQEHKAARKAKKATA